MTGLDTVTLNKAFDHALYLEAIFLVIQECQLDMLGLYSRNEWMTEQ